MLRAVATSNFLLKILLLQFQIPEHLQSVVCQEQHAIVRYTNENN